MNKHVKSFNEECARMDRVSCVPFGVDFEKLSNSLSKFSDDINSTIYVTPILSSASVLISLSFKFQNKFVGVTLILNLNNYLNATLQISELISKFLYTDSSFNYIVTDELCKDLNILSEWIVK